MFKLKPGLTALFLLPSCVGLKRLTKSAQEAASSFIIYDSDYGFNSPSFYKERVKYFPRLINFISVN